MKKQRILSLLMALVMTFSLMPATAMAVKTENFTDVSKGDWYYKYVDFVAKKNYFVGTSDTTFSPEVPMTRAMFVVVMAAMEGVKVDNNVAPFSDVPAGTWYSGAVKWASGNGIVAGIGDNKFDPNTPITREQMAVIMNSYVLWHANKHGVSHVDKSKIKAFVDAKDISSWAANAVENCRKWGLIAGDPAGKFNPKNTATRAEVATVVYGLAWLTGGGGGGTFNPTDYIYESLNATLTDVKAELKAQGKLLLDASTLDEVALKFMIDNGLLDAQNGLQITADAVRFGGDKTFASISGVTLGDPNVMGAQEHPINVAALVKVETTSVVNFFNAAYEAAVEYAGKLIGSTSLTAITKAEAVAIAKEIAKDFQQATGISISAATIDAAAAKLQAAPDAVAAYAKGLAQHFKDANGNYYTGDVTFTVGGKVVTVDVAADGKSAALVGTKAAAIKNLAVGIAKELVADLKNVTTFTSLDKINLDFMVDVDFTAPAMNEYKIYTDLYPYCYPVTFSLDLEGTALDNVEYKYHAGHNHINLIVTDEMQAAYAKLASELVEKVVTPIIKNKMAAAMSGMTGTTISVMAAPADLGSINLKELMNDAIDAWVAENLTGDLANSALLDYMSGNKDAVLNNEALYEIIDATLTDTIDKAIEEAGIVPGKVGALTYAENPESIKELLQDYAGDVYDTLEDNGLLDYTIANVQAALDPNGVKLPAGSAGYVEEARPEMMENVDKAVTDAIDNVVAPSDPAQPDMSKYVDMLDKAAKLATFEGAAELKLSSLATALRNDTFQAVVGSHGDSVVARVTDLIEYIPAGASVKIAGKTIDKAALAAVQAAETSVEACEAVADIIDMFGSLSLSSFTGEGQPVSVNYNSKSLEFFVSVEY